MLALNIKVEVTNMNKNSNKLENLCFILQTKCKHKRGGGAAPVDASKPDDDIATPQNQRVPILFKINAIFL